MKKKTLFVFKIDHSIDLITNSSSELFVLQGQNLEMVKEAVQSLHAEFLSEDNEDVSDEDKTRSHSVEAEYDEIVSVSEASADQLETYFSQECGYYGGNIIPGFKYEDMYEEKKYSLHFLKRNFVEENVEAVREYLDPDKNKYLMFSSVENPVWGFQEKLSNIGSRYHLG